MLHTGEDDLIHAHRHEVGAELFDIRAHIAVPEIHPAAGLVHIGRAGAVAQRNVRVGRGEQRVHGAADLRRDGPSLRLELAQIRRRVPGAVRGVGRRRRHAGHPCELAAFVLHFQHEALHAAAFGFLDRRFQPVGIHLGERDIVSGQILQSRAACERNVGIIRLGDLNGGRSVAGIGHGGRNALHGVTLPILLQHRHDHLHAVAVVDNVFRQQREREQQPKEHEHEDREQHRRAAAPRAAAAAVYAVALNDHGFRARRSYSRGQHGVRRETPSRERDRPCAWQARGR